MKKLLFFNFSILCAAMLLTSNTMQAALGGRLTTIGRQAVLRTEQQAAAAAGRQCKTVCTGRPSYNPSGIPSPIDVTHRLSELEAEKERLLNTQKKAEEDIKKTTQRAQDQIEQLDQAITLIKTAHEAEDEKMHRIQQAESVMEPSRKELNLAQKELEQAKMNNNNSPTEQTKNELETAQKKLNVAIDAFSKATVNARNLGKLILTPTTPTISDAQKVLGETLENPENLYPCANGQYTKYCRPEQLGGYKASIAAELNNILQKTKAQAKYAKTEQATRVKAALETVRDHPEFNQLEPDVQEGILTEIDKLGTTIYNYENDYSE